MKGIKSMEIEKKRGKGKGKTHYYISNFNYLDKPHI